MYSFSVVHRVITNFPIDIVSGQRVYVSGKLITDEFKNKIGRTRFRSTTIATDLSLIKPCGEDINLVEAKGLAHSILSSTPEYCMFRLLTSYWSK